MRASSWNQISIGVAGGRPSRWALSARGKFFKCLDDPPVLGRVARPGAYVGKAELLEKLANVTFVIVDAEPLGDDALEVDPSPAHDAVLLAIRTYLDDGRELDQLLSRQARLGTLRPIVDEPFRPSGVEAMNPIAQRLPVHAADPGRRAPVHPVPHRSQRQQSTALVPSFDRRASARSSSAE